MKKIISLLSLLSFLLFFACEQEFQPSETENSLIGSWQLSESFMSIGGAGSWQKVEDGMTYTFENNGIFRVTKFEDCSSGSYIVEGNKIRMKYDCVNPLADFENAAGELVEQFKFVGKYLYINPTYIFCTEPCDNRYLRIE
ncbi:MAG: lipocalin family protein [Bacteroidia bacterium]|nr:lipocalin family protein [Bacteroidia bacterium]